MEDYDLSATLTQRGQGYFQPGHSLSLWVSTLRILKPALSKSPQDVECLLKEREYSVSGAETAASHAKESQVLSELAKLPVDCLKVSNAENVRI